MKTFEFRKAGKTLVTLDGNFLRIKRSGFLNRANHGSDGEKTLDINNITGVQLKNANMLTNGYIQFLISGSQESKGGLLAATKDENTIMFAKKEQEYANEIKNYIESYMRNKSNYTNSPIVIEKTDVASDIKKFKELLDEGIITVEEFEAKKKQLLGL